MSVLSAMKHGVNRIYLEDLEVIVLIELENQNQTLYEQPF
jgi:hypothetical protein